jgi:hypothetical protein
VNRQDFIAPKGIHKSPIAKAVAKKVMLNGSFYCAIGFVPGTHTFTGYKSAVVSHRRAGQRKDRKISIAPQQFRTKEDIINALNTMLKHVEENYK